VEAQLVRGNEVMEFLG